MDKKKKIERLILEKHASDDWSERAQIQKEIDKLEGKKVKKVKKDKIWENYQKPISTDDLARIAALSRAGLFKAFIQKVGRTPGNELNRVRMENAKKLLFQSQMKLDEIAELSGYQNTNSFWIAFKQSTGMSPRQYQKQFCV